MLYTDGQKYVNIVTFRHCNSVKGCT